MEEALWVGNVLPGPLPERWSINYEGLAFDSGSGLDAHARAQAEWERCNELRRLGLEGAFHRSWYFGHSKTRILEMHRVFFSAPFASPLFPRVADVPER